MGNPNTRPYGDGTEPNAGIIAVGEMWGSHCEYIYTNRHYGNGGNASQYLLTTMQGAPWGNPNTVYTNVGTIPNLNCYLAAVESFNPNNLGDPWRWIPQGLPYDLIDDRNDNNFSGPVIDNVSGFTIQQCFTALQSDVSTIPAFKDRLLQQNGNSQFVYVTDLFFRYGY